MKINLLTLCKHLGLNFYELLCPPKDFARIIEMLENKEINRYGAKTIFYEIANQRINQFLKILKDYERDFYKQRIHL